MKDSTIELLDLINKGKSVNEISEIMNLSNKAIYIRLNMLRNAGYNFKKSYYTDGNIIYSNACNMAWYNEQLNGFNLIAKDNTLRAAVISDLHFGSVSEIKNVMDKVYDYCIKNNIHIILFGGDLLDGTFGSKKTIENTDEQIEYFMNNYPFDKNILNFGVLGDHDYSIYKNTSKDFSLILNNYRHDIIPLGYCIGRLNIGQDQLIFLHGNKNKYLPDNISATKNPNFEKYTILSGHSHGILKVFSTDSNTNIELPTLSLIGKNSPSIAEVNLTMDREGVFSKIYIKHLLLRKSVTNISEFECNIISKKKNNYCNLFGNVNSNYSNCEINEKEELNKTRIKTL